MNTVKDGVKMKVFYLPDLGEGLAEAEIREWYVKVGDEVTIDQPLVSMETAKAVVDVPSPYAGKIQELHGKANDVIKTGAPLITFASEKTQDQGSVVGKLESQNQSWEEQEAIIGRPANRTRATSSIGDSTASIHGVRRAMAQAMMLSHQEVVPVTIFDDANITHLSSNQDLSVLLLQAMAAACKVEPALNAWFDGKKLKRQLFDEVNIGLAVDSAEGLLVPVIKDVASQSTTQLRQCIDAYKQGVNQRTLSAADMQGATMTLSNFGMIAGRYATPIIVPPMVAILGCGRRLEVPIVLEGKVITGKLLPLSLTFDHRAVTGGEATRFLAAVIKFISS